jgi:4-amino-4-deoxychorismate lyase
MNDEKARFPGLFAMVCLEEQGSDMYWINGSQGDLLSASDRGMQFGDGCFTTAAVIDGRIQSLAAHLARLQHASQRLMLPDCQWDILQDEMQNAADGQRRAVLKVILTRGSGGRGYSTQGCHLATRLLTINPYPQHYAQWRQQGIALQLSPVTLGKNPLLAGIKHLNRLEQVLIRHHLDQQTTAQEALVTDSDGVLVECCAANLFWRKGRQVYTPDLSFCGVNGIMRQRILHLLQDSDYQVHVVRESPEVLANADEVLICNSLMPLIPVSKVQDWQYDSTELYDFLCPGCE